MWQSFGVSLHQKSMRTSRVDRCEPRYAGPEFTNRDLLPNGISQRPNSWWGYDSTVLIFENQVGLRKGDFWTDGKGWREYTHRTKNYQNVVWNCINQTNTGFDKYHNDVIKWKHFPCYWPFVRGIHRSPVNSPHKGQWRGALMFSLICARINVWVNNR